MKIVSIAALLGAASAAPMAFTNADGTVSEHLSGGLAHDSARHDERCAAGDNIDCHVEEGWSFGACSTTCGQGTATRTRAVTVTPCNNGAACPATTQTRECMHAVCMCEKVECKFETHSCTNYQDAQTGVQYHSDTELWSGYGNAPNSNVAAANAMVATPTSATARHTSIVDRDTRGSTGNAGFTSAFDNRHDEVNAATCDGECELRSRQPAWQCYQHRQPLLLRHLCQRRVRACVPQERGRHDGPSLQAHQGR
jgi:hypothetical protein